ncbi:hypothetical protein CsSME_00033253 [Camellia sinensis var. sinensis]
MALVEDHCESLLVDSNPVSGNISLRKKFHHEEDSMMAKSSEDGSPSQSREQNNLIWVFRLTLLGIKPI